MQASLIVANQVVWTTAPFTFTYKGKQKLKTEAELFKSLRMHGDHLTPYLYYYPYRHRPYIIQYPKCRSQWLCGWYLCCRGDYSNVPDHNDNCGSTRDCPELAIHHMSNQVWLLFPQHQETEQVLTYITIVESLSLVGCVLNIIIMLFFHCLFFEYVHNNCDY